MIKVKRALISVSDKTGILELARGLHYFGVEIISTGGTAKTIREAGIPVKDVSEYTGFPEMLDGRVKTLHPKIHGGLLALRDNPEHMKTVTEHGIGLIDMVVVNLYPFEKVIQKKNVSLEEAIENIDIGGPSMLRSAAKNYKSVAVVTNPARYEEVLKELKTNSGILPDALLFNLAVEVFERTGAYDRAIAQFLNKRFSSEAFTSLPQNISMSFVKVQDLRYGENPHQPAAFYRDADSVSGLAKMKQLHGKELSFNNILDLYAAADIAYAFANPAAVVIKHNNPCGVAEDKELSKAYLNAWSCDKLSAFGGIIGLNRPVDKKTAEAIIKSGFMECIIAPAFEKSAQDVLTQKKNLRLIELAAEDFKKDKYDFKKVSGGLLLQEADTRELKPEELKVVTKKKPTKAQVDSMLFGWKVVKYVKSNAIVLAKGTKTIGIGMGQTSRVDSAELALRRAGKLSKGAVLASDAFLPKADTLIKAAKMGVKAIIQTGGSIADPEVIKEADKRGITMVVTGIRHFRH
ncbi:MAG: bifunctional phosphoribosylaminoimidazolecarboxamide formyltransferase/IMP cyclohydrolase [Candidatus Omnitrophica bacterium]|nr:bifunctional phosphoribosylaminoimidazolecarboxamide formyltransferase/IMP cyclohydrolase [Candidatus Omnitrophota bacterium]